MQFSPSFSNCVLSNIFLTNHYHIKSNNLFYWSLKFKMDKEICKIIYPLLKIA